MKYIPLQTLPLEVIGPAIAIIGLVYTWIISRKEDRRYDEREEKWEKNNERWKELESQIERERELESLASELQETKEVLNFIQEVLTSPLSSEDLRFELEDLAGELISVQHFTSEIPIIEVSSIYRINRVSDEDGSYETEREVMTDEEQALLNIQDGEQLFIDVIIRDDTTCQDLNQTFMIGQTTGGMSYTYDQINKLHEKEELLGQFDEELTGEITEIVDRIALGYVQRLFENTDGTEVDVNQFVDKNQTAEGIYAKLVVYDGMNNDLKGLKEANEKVEKIRYTVATASLS